MSLKREQEESEEMIRELQLLDRECSKANNCTILRRDFTLFGHDFVKDSASFLKDVERTAMKTKRNDVTMIAVIKN
jgi:hypothetical protein